MISEYIHVIHASVFESNISNVIHCIECKKKVAVKLFSFFFTYEKYIYVYSVL